MEAPKLPFLSPHSRILACETRRVVCITMRKSRTRAKAGAEPLGFPSSRPDSAC